MKLLLLLFGVVLMQFSSRSQTLQITTNANGKSTFNEIINDGNVIEYYSYVNGVLHVYDLMLNEKTHFSLGRGRDTRLLEVSKSSNHYLFVLFNSSNSLEFEIRNESGTKMGDWSLTDLTTLQEMQIGEIAKGGEIDYNLVYPLAGQGFIVQFPSRKSVYGMDVKLLDFNAKVLWSWSTENTSGSHYFGDILSVSPQYVLLSICKKNNALGNKMELLLKVIDVQNGSEIFSREMISKDSELLNVQSGFVENKDQTSTITIFGEYYEDGKDPVRDKSEGLFIESFSAQGEELSFRKLDWDIELKETTASTRNASLCVHRAVRDENGDLVVIGEQFRKSVNLGTAIANLAFDDQESVLEIQIHDLVVFKFSSTGELLQQQTIQNPVRHITWNDGSAIQSSVLLMRRLKRSGYFAYRFSTLDVQKHVVRVVYSLTYDPDYRRKNHADIIIGVVECGSDGIQSFKVPLKSEVNMFGLYCAKSGSIAVAEYSPKFDLLQLKLVDLVPNR